jgi:DNA-binding IclR family transcriptional regulator
MSQDVRTPPPPSEPATRYSAPAAACCAELLLLLSSSPEPVSIPEIARRIGASKSLVFRLIHELEPRQFVRRTEAGKISLGVAALELAGAYLEGADYAVPSREALRDLTGRTGESSNLGVLRGGDVLYVMKQEPLAPVVSISYIGKRLPANCSALGKVLLAQQSQDLTELFPVGLPRLTKDSITSFEQLGAELERVREQGYAHERHEAIPGRCCLAIPVEVIGLDEPAALSIATQAERLDAVRDDLLAELRQTADRLRRQVRTQSALEDGRLD